MYVVTKTLVFPQKRRIELAPTPGGVPQPDPSPIVVTLEVECETEEEVNSAATLGAEAVRMVGAHLQGHVVFSRTARGVYNDLSLMGLRLKSVTVLPSPGFAVRYVPQFEPVAVAAEQAVELAS